MSDLIIRIPKNVKNKWMQRKIIIENILKKKKVKVNKKSVSLAKTLDFYSHKPVFIYEDEVIRFFKKKGGCRWT